MADFAPAFAATMKAEGEKMISPMKDIVIYILGALTTVATQVVSYFFGASSGSADKSKALNALAKRG